jgi:hypothetical protein
MLEPVELGASVQGDFREWKFNGGRRTGLCSLGSGSNSVQGREGEYEFVDSEFECRETLQGGGHFIIRAERRRPRDPSRFDEHGLTSLTCGG